MKKRSAVLLASLAAGLILASTIGSASAYFSAYTTAEGSVQIHLGSSTELEEPEVAAGVKHLVITCKEGSQPVYVRATAFAGQDVTLTYASNSGHWVDGGDGYWYYADGSLDALLPLAGGEKTDGDEELLVHVSRDVTEENVGDTYNVVVIYEATPVLYDESGNPYADWNLSAVQEGGAD